jgi:peroxiredoxin
MNSPVKAILVLVLIGFVIFVYAFMLTAEPTRSDYAGEEWAASASQMSYTLAVSQPRSFSSCCGGSTYAPSYSVNGGGGYAPDFAYTTIENRTGRLADFVGYKHVVLCFYYRSSGPCRTMLSELQAFYRRFSNKVEVIGVTVDDTTNPRDMDNLAEEMGLDFPLIHDPTTAIATTFFHQQVPHVVVIDINGNIVGTITGTRSSMDDILKATFLF